jgi:DNA-directed RNA polymerase subunit K/omega
LDREKVHVDRLVEPLKSTWTRKSLSIICDGWTDVQRRALINFIAITDGGPMFLKAVNCQGEVKDKFFIFTIIKEVIEKVRPQNVVQVVTDNASVCKAAGMLIESQYPSIFWTPCVVHTLNLSLKNICAARNTDANQIVYDECSWINIIVSVVFVIKNFINNHSMRLHMYFQCCDLKLLSAVETRFASVIVVLKRFFQVKRGLKELVIKECWNEYQDDNVDKANFIREKILDEIGFWKIVPI